MFKTIIADLEINHISSIKSYIEANFKQFKVEKVFSNEKDFYKYAKNNHINLIIMEIRFLGIDFFKKIKEFSELYPDTKFIVYGSIADIDYLNKSLEIGAVAYATRPVKPTDLQKCLNSYLDYYKALETLKKENELLDIEYIQNFKVFKAKFLSLLIDESIFGNDEIESTFEYFDIKVSPPYTVALFRIDSFREVMKNITQKEKQLLIFRILKIINNNLQNKEAFINLFNEVVVIMGGDIDLQQTILDFKYINSIIKKELDKDISCGIGRTYDEPKKIRASFLEANKSLRYRCLIGYNSIIPIEYVEPENNITSIYPYKHEQILVQTACIGEYEYCIILLNELFEEIHKLNQNFEAILPQVIMSILISINRNAFEQGLKIEPVSNFFPTKEVLALKTITQAYDFLKKGLEDFCQYISNFRSKNEENIFEKIINYISEQYSKDISYEHLAEKFNLNSKYIKKIFEERINKNIEDYIDRIRIDKAKELILQTSLTDDLIALKIGYDDVNTFRQTFKKFEKRLVGDFRYINKDIRG